ncbi:polyketide cyclase [Mycolicibacterium sp. TY66]|uniref:SRPBCC family protein n=1 Tax=unclassified Mycolicibacterium TaxID=2636767 RepID=UPI001BB3324A|nr:MULTISPECIES: SRPBCC family protein [unclassified Mycolicibacterium]BCI84072.1 polyketide cyclase [Mycolicibacterium sp. TY66]BCJ84309.1 polyketide cyclase [Mycolicibacterium sp. TY81]
MAGETPLLQADITINAPVAKVWALISDLDNMPKWSPQCRVMKAVGAVKVGTKTVNLNRRGALFWPTTSTITAVDPQKKLSFRVNTNNTQWTYDLEPAGTGTKLTVSRRAEAVKPISSTLINRFMGGVPNFEVELVEGMNTSLSRIKTAAEGA